jgi:hypothetical protein
VFLPVMPYGAHNAEVCLKPGGSDLIQTVFEGAFHYFWVSDINAFNILILLLMSIKCLIL